MSDWLAYIGAIGGLIGSATGIAGAVMGYISYRRSEEIKALDLRLELRKAENTLRTAVAELLPLLDSAKMSRTGVAAASGLHESGAMVQWLGEWDADLAAARSLKAGVPGANADYAALTHADLEAKLIAVHALEIRAAQLRDKYRAALADDDKRREQIRADHHARPSQR
jgi:hypothetical protein